MLRTPSVFFFLFPINDSACVNYHLLSFNSLDSQKKKKKKQKTKKKKVLTHYRLLLHFFSKRTVHIRSDNYEVVRT